MPNLIIHPAGPLHGCTAVPGDKSITHRALILGALAEGDTVVRGWVPAEVCLATLRCMQALGATIDLLPPVSDRAEGHGHETGPSNELLIRGRGLSGLREPADVLHCAGSGTTIRLLAGLLAGQPFTSVLTGTEPLRRRPMGRVAEPLRQMGATILGRQGGRLAPLTIRGGALHGIEYAMPVASAQVKSAILLAGLFAEGETVVHEPGPSRDHTERMLAAFEVEVKVEAEGRGAAVRLVGGQTLAGGKTITVPGDFSSAAFPLVAAAIVPGSAVRLTGVGVNPTRTGLYDLLEMMGAKMSMGDAETRRHGDAGARGHGDAGTWGHGDAGTWGHGDAGTRGHGDAGTWGHGDAGTWGHGDTGTWGHGDAGTRGHGDAGTWGHGDAGTRGHGDKHLAASPRPSAAVSGLGEPIADLLVQHNSLRATEAAGDLIVRAIDEFPIFAVAATQAEGTTVVREAAELRVKESDRIASVAVELRKMGAQIEERPDGMLVHGPTRLHGAVVECHRDHRLAMALAVAGLVADDPTEVRGAEAIGDSFPNFVETMQGLGADVTWSSQ